MSRGTLPGLLFPPLPLVALLAPLPTVLVVLGTPLETPELVSRCVIICCSSEKISCSVRAMKDERFATLAAEDGFSLCVGEYNMSIVRDHGCKAYECFALPCGPGIKRSVAATSSCESSVDFRLFLIVSSSLPPPDIANRSRM